jgi:hypothetical protein
MYCYKLQKKKKEAYGWRIHTQIKEVRYLGRIGRYTKEETAWVTSYGKHCKFKSVMKYRQFYNYQASPTPLSLHRAFLIGLMVTELA